MARKINLNRQILEDLYFNKKFSSQRVADHFGVSECCVRKNLKRYGLKLRTIQEVNYKGGKWVDHRGYIHIRKIDHPFASNGYIREHRYIMEKHLGRYLTKDEVVDHVNGNKSDNRIDNLRLFNSQAEHIKIEGARGVYKNSHKLQARDEMGRFIYGIH